MTAAGATSHSLGRQAMLMLAAVAVLLTCVVLVAWLCLRAVGFPVVLDRVSDHESRVSVEVPIGWHVEAPNRGEQITTDDGSSGEGEPYRIPDLHAVSWVSGDSVTYFDVEVGPAPHADRRDDQATWVAEACKIWTNCIAAGPAHALLIDGEPAQAQVRTANGYTLYLATARHGDTLVRYQGFSDVALDGGQEFRDIVQTLRFDK